MKHKAAIYLRRSTDRQEQSVDDQRTALFRYAAAHDIEIVREYCDDAISGATTAARKSFLRMLDDAQLRPRPFDLILVFDISRFGRIDNDEAGHIRYMLRKAGVEVVYTAEGFRGDRTDELVRPLKQAIAAQTLVDLSKITLRGQLSRVNKGRWCGGRAPYGFDLACLDGDGRVTRTVRFHNSGDREVRTSDGTLIEVVRQGSPMPAATGATTLVLGDPIKVAVVRRIFERYTKVGMGLGAVAASLNGEAVPSPFAGTPGKRGGGTWSVGTIREVLRNPAYAGDMVWNRLSYSKFFSVRDEQAVERPKTESGKLKRNVAADWVVVKDAHEPLLPRELFDETQRLLRMRAGAQGAESVGASRRNSPYLLSGLVRCARCGSKFQGYKTCKGRAKPGRKRIATFYYACGGHVAHGNAKCARTLIPKDDFEQLVVAAARDHLTTFTTAPGAEILMQALVAEANDAEGAFRREDELKRRIAGERKSLDGMIACLTPELAPVLGDRIVAAKRRIDELEAQLAEAARARTAAKSAEETVSRLLKDSGALRAAMDAATFHETREILRNVVFEIVVDPGGGDGRICFHAAPLTTTAALGIDATDLTTRTKAVIAARNATQSDASTTPDASALAEAVAGAPERAQGDQRAKKEEDATAKGDHVLSLVMAGAGFEPATSGL